MIQLAWRFLLFQRQSALAQWYQARTADSRLGTPKTMIVALARKLLIALWRFVTTGDRRKSVARNPKPRREETLAHRYRCYEARNFDDCGPQGRFWGSSMSV